MQAAKTKPIFDSAMKTLAEKTMEIGKIKPMKVNMKIQEGLKRTPRIVEKSLLRLEKSLLRPGMQVVRPEFLLIAM